MTTVRKTKALPGASPGIELHPEVDQAPPAGTIRIRCIDYDQTHHEASEVEDLDAFLATKRPEWARVRWINVDGLNPYVVNRLREAYSFHTLAAEDALHVPQRSKLEPYDDHLFVVAHMPLLEEERLIDLQVSLVYFSDTILTFQERPGEVWGSVRKRIQKKNSRLRTNTASYLLYALLDSVVDQFFPLLESVGDQLEEIEDEIVDAPRTETLQKLYSIKRDLVTLRRIMWQMRLVVDELRTVEDLGFDKQTLTFLRDVHDHALRVIDMIETYREMSAGLTDLYMSSISNRMNEVMKVLTIMASLFIPMSFLAGVYGMNFEYMPELGWKGSYPIFWLTCLSVTAGLLIYFRRKGWIGRQ